MALWLTRKRPAIGATVAWLRPLCALAACLLLAPLICAAQQPDAPDAAKSKAPAQSAPDKPKTDATGRPLHTSDAPGDKPDAAPAPAPKPDAAADNPFPEDVSRGAAAKAAQGDSPDAPAAAGEAGADSSSSSSSSANPDSAGGTDPNPEPDVPAQPHRRRLGKPSSKDIQSGSLAGEGRAEQDVRVGRYYLTQHNYLGAYGRFQDAAHFDPANVEAIYGVAAAAEGLHKTDEALQNYKLYLQIAPDGDHAKLAERSLKALSK
jgi:tetratricopeptide (TPR) repeat protein